MSFDPQTHCPAVNRSSRKTIPMNNVNTGTRLRKAPVREAGTERTAKLYSKKESMVTPTPRYSMANVGNKGKLSGSLTAGSGSRHRKKRRPISDCMVVIKTGEHREESCLAHTT